MSHSISDELTALRAEIPEGVTLVAVSKFHPVEAVREAYDAGQRCFGESRVQELLEKIPQLAGKTSLIESVDSERLLQLIDRESERAGVVTRVLMQVHVAREETKFGFLPEELLEYFRERRFETLRAVHICGVMGMASNTDDLDRVRADFREIYTLFRTVADDPALGLRGFDTVSMGMSGDWKIAVEEGSDMIRIGTRIFGPREY